MKRFCIGRTARRDALKRTLALASVAALTVGTLPALAADKIGDGVTPTCDEAYYATLDYYGNLTNGSVVKSYALNGATSLTDYGTYDTVTNLTDGTDPVTKDGTTTFDFGSDAPDHFYFEGATSQPFTALPWTVSMSYKLNGVPTRAEDLAGKTGVVTINLDIVPNAAASDYAKNNYTLEALTMFNQDNILSLKAEGAQVQLVGNLRMVLFLALPGEEQHFSIEVGTDSFEFDGMTYLMVPATLAQLDQIAKLKEHKQEIEDDYDKLNGSLDTFLNSLDAMTGSLRSTAGGLDELHEARGIISAGKGDVYGKADSALADLDSLNEQLGKVPAHLESASQAVTDVTNDLTELTKTSTAIKSNLGTIRDELNDVQEDLDDVNDALKSNDGLKEHITKLGNDMDKLESTLESTRKQINALGITVNGGIIDGLDDATASSIKLNGQSLKTLKTTADTLQNTFNACSTDGKMSFSDFCIAATMISKGVDKTAAEAAMGNVNAITQGIAAAEAAGMTEEQAVAYVRNANSISDEDWANYQTTVSQTLPGLQAVYSAVGGGSALNEQQFFTAMLMLNDINTGKATAAQAVAAKDTYAANAATLLSLYADNNLSDAANGLLADMSNLCEIMGSDGVSGDLSKLVGLTSDTLDDMDDMADTADTLLDQVQVALDRAAKLDDTINKYVPDTVATLTDAKDMVTSLSTTITDTHGFLSSFESLAKKAGTKLDSGTQKTLAGLAGTLRKAADSIDTTDSIRSAKDNIDDIITSEWDDHTGDVDNLLNMDNTAPAVSLTSVKNGSPQSVQVLIRSQEIKIPDEDETTKEEATADQGTLLSRIGKLFQNIWSTITGVFQK